MIWAEVFWKRDPNPEPEDGAASPSLTSLAYLIVPIAGLALITISIGFFAEPFFVLANAAAQQLMNPDTYYIPAVLTTVGA